MARPVKKGLDYFPLDTNYYEDDKMLEVTYEHGYLAEVLWIRLLGLIFRNGYYIEASANKIAKLFNRTLPCNENQVGVETLETIIISFGKYGLLDKSLMEEEVLTSKGIQKQYLLSTNRRKKVVFEKYVLLNEVEILESKKFLLQKEVNKQIKNTASKPAEIYGGTVRLHFLTKCLINGKYVASEETELFRYNNLFEEIVEQYTFDVCLTVTNYIIKYAKKTNIEIESRFDFFKKSAINNCELMIRKEEGGFDYDDFIKTIQGLGNQS